MHLGTKDNKLSSYFLAKSLESLSNKIEGKLRSVIEEYSGFPNRTFYASTFALAFLSKTYRGVDGEIKDCLVKSYDDLDKKDPEFHWEFNNYALSDYCKTTGDQSVRSIFNPLRFKGTPCTNWTLLRLNVQFFSGGYKDLTLIMIKRKLRNMQRGSGLIRDDVGVNSFQYHCFSAAMLGEVALNCGDRELLQRFDNSVKFISKFILRNGEALYVGRGQNQAFGYGALVYILALSLSRRGNFSALRNLASVIRFVKTCSDNEREIPLVFGQKPVGQLEDVDCLDQDFCGWYPYNNYYDYLAFLGYFIIKAKSILEGPDLASLKEFRDGDIGRDYIIVTKDSYDAVLAKPGGYLTNDLPIPYVVKGGRNITPCYGGEQFQDSLYTEKGIPLPFFNRFQKSIRWRSISFFIYRSLILISPLGVMIRFYKFNQSSIDVRTLVLSPFNFRHVYLCLWGRKCIIGAGLREVGSEYSASGKLVRLESKGFMDKVEIII